MKLNYRRTILVGFAFFLISAFWQAYDATIPVILTNKFGMSQTWSGVIMALDNILAVFMLPLFGAISDKCLGSKNGRRTPFITIGTIIAAVALVGLSFADNAQLKNISAVSEIDDTSAMTTIYETQKDEVLMTPEGDKFVLSQKYGQDAFVAIQSEFEVLNIKDPIAIFEKADFDISYKEGQDFYLDDEFTKEAFASVLSSLQKEEDVALLQLIYDLDLPIHVIDGKGHILAEGLSEEITAQFEEHLKSSLLGGAKLTKLVTNPE